MQQKIKRGFRFQVSDPRRGTESGAAKMGLIWLVLDTQSGDDEHPIVATEVTRAKAREVAKRLNDGHKEHSVRGL